MILPIRVSGALWAAVLALLVSASAAGAAQWTFMARDHRYLDAKGEAHSLNAFLWIPPVCARVRGVLLVQQGVAEQGVVESAAIRDAARVSDVAIVFLTPGLSVDLGVEPTVTALTDVLAELARISGYDELATAPWLPFGHSTNGVWALRLGAASPARTVAVISFKGQLPLIELAAVPVLTVHGEFYEWMKPGDVNFDRRAGTARLLKGLRAFRTRFDGPHALLIDPGHSHFDCRPELTAFLASYISKAFAARVSGDASLRAVEMRAGAVTENASWYFDAAQAASAEQFQAVSGERADQMTTFVDAAGNPLPLGGRGLIEPLTPKFEEDGVSFTIRPGFLSTVPPALAHGGEPLGHAETPPESFKLNGHFIGLGGNRFRFQPDMTWPNAGGGDYVLAIHPGDEHFRPAVQPGLIPKFEKNREGKAQRIAFPEIADQVAGVASVELKAQSDAGLPVSYYVLTGPAEVQGNKLVLAPLPPRTHFPVKVTVVAWQWGRSREPNVQTAEFVERSFSIVAKGE